MNKEALNKEVKFFVRMDQEMLDALDAEAERLGENHSVAARMLLREALTARGHYTVLAKLSKEASATVQALAAKRAVERAAKRKVSK